MSNLRILGCIIGILGLFATFLIYRGPKWKRSNFAVFSLFNLGLIVITINPDSVNFLRDLFSLQASQHGRLIALLIISNIFVLFFLFYTKSKVEKHGLQFDQLIRNLGIGYLEKTDEIKAKIKSITVVIPAYNEAENLNELLARIPDKISGSDVGVLVVDDGSEDDTIKVAQKYNHLVVSNRINRGQGAASRLGYDILIKYDVAVGVTMDADNQHRPEDMEKLVAPILDNKFDLVIGSRILGSQEKISRFRNTGIFLLTRIINYITGMKITDCSSGYKAFNIQKIKNLQLTEDQFQAAEVLIEARKKGLRIGEVPITINRRKHGRSKKGTDWSYGFYFAKTILKTWWR